MKCPKCLAENPEGMKFCIECGADGRVEKGEERPIFTSIIVPPVP